MSDYQDNDSGPFVTPQSCKHERTHSEFSTYPMVEVKRVCTECGSVLLDILKQKPPDWIRERARELEREDWEKRGRKGPRPFDHWQSFERDAVFEYLDSQAGFPPKG